jgi:hypothetical protein
MTMMTTTTTTTKRERERSRSTGTSSAEIVYPCGRHLMAVIYTAFEKTKHHLPLSSSRSNLSFNNTVTSGHVSKSSRRCMTSRRKRNREKREREREREREK